MSDMTPRINQGLLFDLTGTTFININGFYANNVRLRCTILGYLYNNNINRCLHGGI